MLQIIINYFSTFSIQLPCSKIGHSKITVEVWTDLVTVFDMCKMLQTLLTHPIQMEQGKKGFARGMRK